MHKFRLTLALGGVMLLGACTHGVQVADVNLGSGVVLKAIRVPATMNTPGLTAIAAPSGVNGGVNIAAVGGNGLGGDLIRAAGGVVAGGLGALGSAATATVNVAASAVATNTNN